jgi:para-nitrobenzyl esterase
VGGRGLVWILGGGYRGGWGEAHGEGDAFAAAGVLVVSFNYRLGALGFTHLAGVFGDSERDAGACGLLDQIAALRWVSRNVAAFGGDPRRVTIYGVSAGGKSVGNLLASPAAAGLFSQAISASGGADHVATPEVGAELARRLLAELDDPDPEELRRIPAREIFAAQERILSGIEGVWVWRPTVHPEVLPAIPIGLIAQGSAAGVRLLLGTGGNEATTFEVLLRVEGAAPGAATAPADEVLGGILGATGQAALLEAIGRGRGLSDPDAQKLAAMGEERYGIPSQRLADAQAGFADVYRYRYDAVTPGLPESMRAGHGTEVPMVWQLATDPFGNPISGVATPAQKRLGQAMHDAWVSFVRTGFPSAEGLPTWPRYDPDVRAVMIFDDEPRVEEDPRRDERLAWGDASWPSGTWFPIPDRAALAGAGA